VSVKFAADAQGAIPVELVEKNRLEDVLGALAPEAAVWVRATGFAAGLGEVALLPDAQGGLAQVLYGLGADKDQARLQFPLGSLRAKLPAGVYHITTARSADEAALDGLGWLLSGYKFDRYRDKKASPAAELAVPSGQDAPAPVI